MNCSYIKKLLTAIIVVSASINIVHSAEQVKANIIAVPIQTIYYGGDIITMEGDKPQYVEAIVQRDGKIVFVGSKADALKAYQGKAKEVDLEGKTLLPGFIDGHSHIYSTGLMALFANVMPAPDGPGNSFNDIISTTKEWMNTDNGRFVIKKYGWVIANGYDDSQLQEKAHPTADILDKISTQYPVIVMHQSGHLAAFNHKALELGGFSKASKDPEGGHIQRDSNNNPNGVLEEEAFFGFALPIFSKKVDGVQRKAIIAAQKNYAKSGYTTAQDGRSTPDNTDALENAAKAGDLFIDVVAYPDIVWNQAAAKNPLYNQRKYTNHYRVGGVKFSLDGSPQGKTAWLTKPYFHPPHGMPADYKGFPQHTDEETVKYVKMAFKNKWQLLSHTNGDAAADQYLMAIGEAQKELNYDDHRTVIIHGQTMRKDQLKDAKNKDVYISFYPAHTYYWGDWHRDSVLGKSRASYISPMRDAIDLGINTTSHHDAPVIPPSAMRVLDAPINRITRSGKILGKAQRISVYEGLQSLTIWAANQYFEEGNKGTLKVGKLADLVILEKNPLKINPLNIHKIEVLKTIKEGVVIFEKR